MLSSDKYIKNRIFGLDLIRSISLLCVLISHSGFERIFGFRYGVLAVEYFFVLSGFLVGEMLLVECGEGADKKKILNFMIKRWFRTLPLYYLVLLLKFALSSPFMGMKIIPYMFFLQNNVGGIAFFPVSWTLVIEEWFYLVLPILIFLFFRAGITKKKFLYFSLGIIVAENVLRIFMAHYLDRTWGGIVGNFPFRFDSFFIGVFLAFVKLHYKEIYERMTRPKFFVGAVILAIFVIILFAMGRGGELDNSAALWVRTVGFFIISVVLTLMVPFFEKASIFNNLSSKNPFKLIITWVSLLSYPIYLIHLDIFHYLSQVTTGTLYTFLSYSIIVVISLLLFLFFHHPVTNLRKRFLIK